MRILLSWTEKFPLRQWRNIFWENHKPDLHKLFAFKLFAWYLIRNYIIYFSTVLVGVCYFMKHSKRMYNKYIYIYINCLVIKIFLKLWRAFKGWFIRLTSNVSRTNHSKIYCEYIRYIRDLNTVISTPCERTPPNNTALLNSRCQIDCLSFKFCLRFAKHVCFSAVGILNFT